MIDSPTPNPVTPPSPIAQRAMLKAVVAERIFPKYGNFYVTSPDGREVWYRVVTDEASSADYQMMLATKPTELGMILDDENLEQWRESLKK